MNLTDDIKILVQRYLDGQTSLEEERQLAGYFQSAREIPPEFQDVAAMLSGFNVLKQDKMENPEFELQLDKHLRKSNSKRIIIWSITAVAAALLLLFALKPGMENESPIPNTLNNPQTAFAHAKKALMLASYNLNKGLKPAVEATSVIRKSISKTEPIKRVTLPVTGIKQIQKTAPAVRWVHDFSNIIKKENY